MTDKRIVLTTTGSKEEAEKLARALVERKLAACVNVIGPIESVYRWKGKVERATEFLLLVKTTATASLGIAPALKELHSYKLPECVVLNVEGGSKDYLDWLAESVAR
jgi:periplasmic divalent cation tolerance protein